MRYRTQITMLLSKEAEAKLGEAEKEIIIKRSSVCKRCKDGSFLTVFLGLPYDDDVVLTDWLNKLDRNNGEVYEIVALGPDMEDIEHSTNTLGEDRLYAHVIVSLDGNDIAEVTVDAERRA